MGVNRRFQAKHTQNIHTFYYQLNDLNDSTQILHSDKDHQVYTRYGSSQNLPHKSKIADGRHLGVVMHIGSPLSTKNLNI